MEDGITRHTIIKKRLLCSLLFLLVMCGGEALAQSSGVKVRGSVFGGGNEGNVGGSVEVNIQGGTVSHDVYGGGAKAHTNESNWNGSALADTYYEVTLQAGSSLEGYYTREGEVYTAATGTTDSEGTYYRKVNTLVNLTGGTIKGDAYGGGLGHDDDTDDAKDQPANVYGDVFVTVDGTKMVTGYTTEGDPVVNAGRVFGCNNIIGSPKGHVRVLVRKTSEVTTPSQAIDVTAVFGGGNLADYEPVSDAEFAEVEVNKPAGEGQRVVVGNVYGGGNEADVAADTQVKIISGEVKTGVYGGCNTSGTVTKDVTVTLTGGTVGTDASHANVHGGGYGENTFVKGNVLVQVGNMDQSDPATVWGDVYGGSALGHVNAYPVTEGADENGRKYSKDNTTTVRLYAGTINGDAYGGGLGAANKPATVGGTVLVELNGTTTKNASDQDVVKTVANDKRGCVVNQIFGANNANGTPKGAVTVHVYRTQHRNKANVNEHFDVAASMPAREDGEALKAYLGRLLAIAKPGGTLVTGLDGDVITAAQTKHDQTSPDATDEELTEAINTVKAQLNGLYDVQAVYGGGNEADFTPLATDTRQSTEVVIEGCDYTSIREVYGGGNAAAVPATEVWILGTKIIDNVFGGGNGERGASFAAHVGYHRTNEGKDDYAAGTGKTFVKLVGGTIYNVFGGSNSHGDIRGGADISMPQKTAYAGYVDNLEGPTSCCPNLNTNHVYGGGKNADMSSGTNIVLGCMPDSWIGEIYAGAQAADVAGDVSLTITSGKFERVFGGNKDSGKLEGSITVNIEETGGCDVPIVIGELYGGGNLAGYSRYGYDGSGNPRTEADYNTWYAALSDEDKLENQPYNDPKVNVRAFTSIGAIYGGGYSALMVGDPSIDINVALGSHANTALSAGDTPTLALPYPAHEVGKIGAIGNVFGGGNLANVIGNTAINIGTETEIELTSVENDPATEDVDEKHPAVLGANITGNVYGGGNAADIIGDTKITIGTVDLTGEGKFGTRIGGDVFGGGFGPTTKVIGDVEVNIGSVTTGETTVYTGYATISGNVYGGSAKGTVNAYLAGEPGTLTASVGKTTEVNMYGGTIGGSIYGGGYGLDNALADVYGPVTVSVYNGSVAEAVYGCNNLNGSPKSTVAVNINGTSAPTPPATFTIPTVYGGGNLAPYTGTGGLSVSMSGGYVNDVFGGGYGSSAVVTANTAVTVSGGSVTHDVYGGGSEAQVTGNTSVTLSGTGAVSNDIYGGGKLAAVTGAVAVALNGGTVGNDVYGGGALAETNTVAISEGVYPATTVTLEGATVTGNVYGGGLGRLVVPGTPGTPAVLYANADEYNAAKGTSLTPEQFAALTEEEKTKTPAVAEIAELPAVAANVYGPVMVTVTDGKATNVFGCNNLNGSPKGTVAVNIEGTTEPNPPITEYSITTVYGGGNLASYTGTGELSVSMSGGYVNDVFGGGLGSSATVNGSTAVTISGGTVNHDVYGGGSEADVTGSVNVVVSGGKIINDVYGGGALANTNTANWVLGPAETIYVDLTSVMTKDKTSVYGLYTESGGVYTLIDDEDAKADEGVSYYEKRLLPGHWAAGKTSADNTTTVKLTGGTIGNAYGGGLGDEDTPVYVFGDIEIIVNKPEDIVATSGDGAAFTQNTIDVTVAGQSYTGVPTTGRVFGCNNINGTPMGDVLVEVYSTVNIDAAGNRQAGRKRYEIQAVYGGGNQADYLPDDGKNTTVNIYGCDVTSIARVYGGGNSASVPNTNVTIWGSYDIEYAFGGGNGGQPVKRSSGWVANDGASVSGHAQITCKGGRIGEVFGGSDFKGDCRMSTTTQAQEGSCPLKITKLYGAGKEANVDGSVNVVISACTAENSEVEYVCGGSYKAYISGDVHLTITAGYFKAVYGGNDQRGGINGNIIVDIEETDPCKPIIIKDLVGGGNQAVFPGKDADGNVLSSKSRTITVNVKSATRIDNVYGGSYKAETTADTEVNINMIQGCHIGETVALPSDYGVDGAHIPSNITFGGTAYVDVTGDIESGKSVVGYYTRSGEDPNYVYTPASGIKVAETHYFERVVSGTIAETIGTIGNVYGGGQQGQVIGNTTVNIGTKTEIPIMKRIAGVIVDTSDVSIYDGEGKQKSDVEIAYVNETVRGAHIEGDVFGGGEKAEVTGSTNVNICAKETSTDVWASVAEGAEKVTIGGSVYGGGSEADVLTNTTVRMSNGYVYDGVYGGGLMGSVGTFTRTPAVTTESNGYDHSTHADDCVGKPTACTSGGLCKVVVDGGQVGPAEVALADGGMKNTGHKFGLTGPVDVGFVFGAGRGEVLNPIDDYDADFHTYVDATNVTIGGTAFIMASVYGGGENGRVLHGTSVTIKDNCQIGCGEGKVDGSNKPIRYTDEQWSGEDPADFKECAHWDYGKDTDGDDKPDKYLPFDPLADVRYNPGDASTPTDASTTGSDGHTYYGNVFGGGSGYYPYEIKNSSGTVVGHSWLRSAGLVQGNTVVNITGGHILTSVYGGNEHSDVEGTCTVNMSGGTLGVPRTDADMQNHPVTCYLFGAGKGDQRTLFNRWTNVAGTTVNVSGTARIFGSVFGGGEDGHVLGDANVTINGGTIGTTGTSYVDGNVFGGGRGFSGDALTAGVVCGNVNVSIQSGTMLGSIYGGGRLASVGTHLVPPGDNRYGTLIEDNMEQVIGGEEDVSDPGKKHGRIRIDISGGIIGNTSVMNQYSGNVYGGCMGRLELLNGTINPLWSMLALAEATTVNITGGTITRNVYGGGEFGTVRDDAHVTVGGTWDPSTETLTKTGGGIINRNVFGGGYGSDDNVHEKVITVPSYSASYKYTPMQWAGCVGGNTYVNIMGGWVKKTVYGGGELASVGVLDYRIDNSNNYTNIIKHENVNTEFALSWPYELTFIPNKAGAPVGGKTNVTVTGGRIGITGKDDMGTGVSEDNGDIYGGSKGLAGDRYDMAFCANVKETEVTINYNTTNGEACDAGPSDYTTTSKKCIAGSVYGGGENGHVMEDAKVKLTSGLIGHAIYGGGKGKDTYKKDLNVVVGSGTYEADVYSITAGKVYGNTSVTMEGGYVVRNIYGGGNMASVGKGNYAGGEDDYYSDGYGEKLAGNLWDNVSDNSKAFLGSGKSTVSITGGTVGTASGEKDDLPYGNVYGGCRGQAAAEVMGIDTNPDIFLGYVNETEVTIGNDEGGSPTIYGSVYGGGQDGHVRRGTSVTIKDGEIGLEHTAANITAVGLKDKNNNDVDLNHFKWKHRGNVYGGGSGIGKYSFDYNGNGNTNDTGVSYGSYTVNEKGFSNSAGHVTHTTSVTINGGTIHRNVYGGGSLASVCPPYFDALNPPNDHAKEDKDKGLMSAITVNVSGGTIGCATDNAAGYGGNVFGACRGESAEGISNDYFALCTQTEVNIQPNTDDRTKDTQIFGNVYGGGEMGAVKRNADVNLTGGRIMHNAYGGGKGTRTDVGGGGVTADIGGNTTVLLNQGVADNAKGCIVNKIFGCNDQNGTPKGHALVHVYATQNAGTASIADKIGPPEYNKVLPKENYKTYLSDLISAATVTGGLAGDASVITTAQTLLNTTLVSTAEANLTDANKTSITDAAKAIIAELEAMHDYDVDAVYGGGDLADYKPTDAESSDVHAMEAARTEVIIEGCDVTSIYQVYGGGNAASSPATEVNVMSVYIIDELFGGGNGYDNFTLSDGKWYENGGANVGYKSFVHYDTGGSHGTGEDEANMYEAITNSNALTPEDRKDPANGYIYGSGVAKTTVTGGHIHTVYGGSNEKGNIRTTAMSQYQKSGICLLLTDATYGGSKNAEIDAEIDMVLDCVESVGDYFGGSTNADINNNVTLNITNGTFGRVFGGNNKAGTINGVITINIEEKGCTPIIIGELYGGGFYAPYSVYGYKKTAGTYDTVVEDDPTGELDEHGNIKKIYSRIPLKKGETGARPTPLRDPHINIVSATSIGSIYGGGYRAKVVGSPHINVNMTTGRILAAYKDKDPSYAEKYTVATDETGDWVIPIGTIGNVYGGGNMADIIGNTSVEIGTGKRHHNTTGEEETLDRNAAFITGNVYGGGKMGHVGDFTLNGDGKPTSCAEGTGTCTVIISNGDIGPDDMNMWHLDGTGNVPSDDKPDDSGHVFGAGQGTNLPANDNDAFVNNTFVTINGTAWVKGSVFGGGENGHVLHDTDVTIADNCQIGNGHILVTEETENEGEYRILVNRGVNRRYTTAEWAAGHLIVGADEFSELSSANKSKVEAQFAASLPECDSWPYGKEISGGKIVTPTPVAHHAPYDKFAGTDGYSSEGGARVASSGRAFNGSVFGGGSGFFPYSAGNWNPKAGQVEGNATVTVTGGHIMTSLFGGCEMSSLLGNAHVTMSGGTVGVPRTLDEIAAHPVTCYVFGGGKGEARALLDGNTNVQNATVDVTGGWVYGSVFGGAEDGHVLGNTTVNISGTTPTSSTTYEQLMAGEATKIGTWGTSYVDGNIFGGGRGFDGHNQKAGRIAGNANINISGGEMLGSVYGGGRLGSVGMGSDGSLTADGADVLYTAGDEIPEGKQVGDVKTPGAKYGHITINITGGTIGNDLEFVIPDKSDNAEAGIDAEKEVSAWTSTGEVNDWKKWKKYKNIPETEFDTSNGRVTHTKGGNVFAGCMGRRLTLSGNVIENWTQLAESKSTKLTISGAATKIKGNVYGGGEFGAVLGNHTTNGKQYGTEISVTNGTIGTEVKNSEDVVEYTFGSVYGGGYGTDVEVTDTLTNIDVGILGALVSDSTYISMSGGHVWASVYGGGEVAAVGGNTNINISGGEIGKDSVRADGYVLFGGATMGNVYGSGKGTIKNPLVGVVKGNTTINISGGSVYHNVYGGGAVASVGSFHPNGSVSGDPVYVPAGVPYGWPDGDDIDGIARINITGGIIGISGHDNGMVNGSSRGNVERPYMKMALFGGNVIKDPYDRFAWVNKSVVNIGTSGSSTGPKVKGSVYGGGENGHNNSDATVNIYSGTIGIPQNETWGDVPHSSRGNVYGAGCGTDFYWEDEDGDGVEHPAELHHNPWAGVVCGNTYVNIYGGHVLHNVYGGGSIGSVGALVNDPDADIHTNPKTEFAHSWPSVFAYSSDASGKPISGKATVNVKGGRIGTTGSDNGDVFGGTKGEAGNPYRAAHLGTLRATEVNIDFTSGTPADDKIVIAEKIDEEDNKPKYSLKLKDGEEGIAGSVYGGGEDGHVYENTQVNIKNGYIGHAVYGGGKGKGEYTPLGKSEAIYSITAGKVYGNTEVNMSGGHVLRNVYGGGNLGSVGKGNYACGPDDYYYVPEDPDYIGYGEKLETNLWDGVSDGSKAFLGSGIATVKVTGGIVGFMANDDTEVVPLNAATSSKFSAVTGTGANPDEKKRVLKVFSKDDLPTGNIFGGCRGQAAAEINDVSDLSPTKKPDFFLGYVNETVVTIGDASVTNGPRIYGSVYGGGQDGHVRRGTAVTINKGEIGLPFNSTNTNLLGGLQDSEGKDNLHWLHRGNVYGGGSGIGKYEDSTGEHESNNAGSVTHTTSVTVNNGIDGSAGTQAKPGNVIYRNVYGGGSLASVTPPIYAATAPNPDDRDGWGKMACNTVTVLGTVGVVSGYDKTYGGEVYGGSRGESGLSEDLFAVSAWTKVFIKKGAHIMGNVFGGGDAGIVKKDTKVVVGDQQ